jgi:hypothetical protein
MASGCPRCVDVDLDLQAGEWIAHLGWLHRESVPRARVGARLLAPAGAVTTTRH